MRVRTVALWLCLAGTTLSAFAGDVLRHETATTIKVGPLTGTASFAVDADGVETESFTVDATVLLSKNGGKLKEVDASLTLDSHDLYDLVLLAEMTDTYGRLDVVIINGNKVIKESFSIINGVVWDQQHSAPRVRGGSAATTADVITVGGTDITTNVDGVLRVDVCYVNGTAVSDTNPGMLEVDIWGIGGGTTAAANLENAFDGYTGDVEDMVGTDGKIMLSTDAQTGVTIPTVTTTGTATNVGTVNGLAANVITNASIATNAMGSDEMGTYIGGRTLAAADYFVFGSDTVTYVQNVASAGVVSLGANVITAASIATDAIGALELAAGAVDEIVVDVATELDTHGAGNWETATGFSTFDPDVDDVAVVTTTENVTGLAANVITAASMNADAVDEIVVDVKTELDTHGGGSWVDTGGGDATEAKQDAIITDLDDIKGTGFVKDTHSLIDVETYVDLIDDGTSGLAKIATDVAAVLVDTDSTIPGLINGLNDFDPDIDDVAVVTTTENVTTVDGLAANVITAASIATAAIDADAIAADAIGSSEINTYMAGRTLAAADYFLFGTDTVLYVQNVAAASVNSLGANVITNASIATNAMGSDEMGTYIGGRTLAAADYFDPDIDDVAVVTTTESVTGLAANVITAASMNADAATEIRTEMDSNSTDLNTLITGVNLTKINSTSLDADFDENINFFFGPAATTTKTVNDVGTAAGTMDANLIQINGTSIAGTDSQVADSWLAFWDVASPTFNNGTALADFKATSVTVSDKTGFKLASDGLDLQTSWTTDITGNITGNLSGSVNSVATDVTSDLVKIHGTALTETNGQLAGRFVNFFDQASASYSVATALSSFKADVSNLDMAISTLNNFDPDVDDVAVVTLTATATDVTNGVSIANGAITTSTFGVGAIDNSALATTAADEIGTRVWVTATRELSGTYGDFDALLSRLDTEHGDGNWITGSGTSTLTEAQVNAQVDTALSDINLDHLASTAAGIPALPAGTWIDTIIDDTNELQTDNVPGLIAALHNFDPDVDDVAVVTTVDAIAGTIGTFDALLPQLDTEHGDGAWTTGGADSTKLLATTVDTDGVDSQTQFVLAAGSDQNNAYNGAIVILTDASNNGYPSIRTATDYVGATKTLVIDAAPGFDGDVVDGDGINIFIAERTLDQAAAIDGKTMRELLRYVGAILAGETSGAGTGVEMFKGLDGMSDRVQVIIDSNGDRANINYDP